MCDDEMPEERKEFERWYRQNINKGHHRQFNRYGDTGLYVDNLLRIVWKAYKHAIKVERSTQRTTS